MKTTASDKEHDLPVIDGWAHDGTNRVVWTVTLPCGKRHWFMYRKDAVEYMKDYMVPD